MFAGRERGRTTGSSGHRTTKRSRSGSALSGLADRGRSGLHRRTRSRPTARPRSLARRIAAIGATEVRRRMAVEGAIYDYTPLSHLRPGMEVLVERDGQLVAESVQQVEVEQYDGPVYDLEVERTHTYVADGVLVHNSIYQFRGADIRNILEFEDAFPDATVIVLEQNYRSTQTILDAANAVIANNLGRKPKELWTDQGHGQAIVRYHADDEGDESQWVAHQISHLHDGDYRWGDVADLLPDQRPEPGDGRAAHALGHPLQGHRRHALLRPPRDQGRAGVPQGGGQPARRGQRQAGHQRARSAASATARSAGSTPGPTATACPSPMRSAASTRPASPVERSRASSRSPRCSTC